MTGHTFMGFGGALDALKVGKRVARRGWNGKKMHIELMKGWLDGSVLGFEEGQDPAYGHPSTMFGVSIGLFRNAFGSGETIMPALAMRAAHGELVPGWLASQTDMLADDWQIVED